jgi:RNA polymerase sigma-70 factor (ECF subfamily)
MVEIPDLRDEVAGLGDFGVVTSASEVTAWFAREVLPLEPALMQFLRHSRRSQSDVEDLCQEVFIRVYEAARQEIPEPAKPFVFTVARNLLLDRVRRDAIVSIETVADLDTLGLAADEPGPDRSAIARQELRRLQAALDRLPPRCREAIVLSKIEGLSRPEVAQRMGIEKSTVSMHLTDGMCALADILYGEQNTPEKNS